MRVIARLLHSGRGTRRRVRRRTSCGRASHEAGFGGGERGGARLAEGDDEDVVGFESLCVLPVGGGLAGDIGQRAGPGLPVACEPGG